MRKRTFIALLLPLGLLGGCSEINFADEPISSTAVSTDSSENSATKDIFAMDTYMRLTAYGSAAEDAVEAAASYIENMDALMSTGLETSEIAQLNATGTMMLSADSAAVMQRAIEICHDTDGAFNPLMYPVMEAWGFPSKEYRVPMQDELEELLTLTDISQVQFHEADGQVSFGIDGMKADLGGIAKGYTSSQIKEIFNSFGVTSGLVTLGGNVQAVGSKTDGSPWRVAVQNPESEGEYLGVLEVSDKAVITSGGYERYFEEDGKKYHHIMDPDSGYPAENGLTSVTIVSEDGTLADALSTALFVMGLENASDYWQEHSQQFDAVFLTETGTILVTEGIEDIFSSGYAWTVIEKES
ncbi:MAG: FAD:protein FMN transferase [Ruminococcus sp.]|nr:FAD:protein FMN transferase [Ruminococcus sp.]